MSCTDFVSKRARVHAVHSDALIDVELARSARCKGCEGSCTWFRSSEAGLLRLQTPTPLVVGQAVDVLLPARSLLNAALLLHGLPWAALLLGAFLGAIVGGTDLSCLVGAGIGFGMTLLLSAAWRKRLELDTSSQFRVVPVA